MMQVRSYEGHHNSELSKHFVCIHDRVWLGMKLDRNWIDPIIMASYMHDRGMATNKWSSGRNIAFPMVAACIWFLFKATVRQENFMGD